MGRWMQQVCFHWGKAEKFCGRIFVQGQRGSQSLGDGAARDFGGRRGEFFVVLVYFFIFDHPEGYFFDIVNI